jgi:hypothetical protein
VISQKAPGPRRSKKYPKRREKDLFTYLQNQELFLENVRDSDSDSVSNYFGPYLDGNSKKTRFNFFFFTRLATT